MENSSSDPEPEPNPTQSSAAFAQDVVTSLDKIFDCLMDAVPVEGADWEVPLTFSEVRAAKKIPHSGTVPMHVLAGLLDVSLPTATHLVDRLVAKGVAVRTRSEHDRRLVLVELSEKSKLHFQFAFRSRVASIERIMAPLDTGALEQVAHALGEIARAISSQRKKRDTAATMQTAETGKRS